jgi:hypothetical protein
MKSPIKRRSPEWLDLIIVVSLLFVVGMIVRTFVIPRVAVNYSEVPNSSDLDDIELMEAGDDEPSESAHGPYGALPSRAEWASKFRKARLQLLAQYPICEACGRGPEEAGAMNAHHVVSVKRIIEEGLDESLKWDVKNLITLDRECHLHYGHDDNFSKSNPNVRRDAAKAFSGCWGKPYSEVVADWRANQPMAVELTKDKKQRSNRERKTTIAP